VRACKSTQLDATLPDQDVDDIVAFMNALTGEPPQVSAPKLPESTSTTPKPDP
jgi:cytochrome c peroxidase